MRGTEREAETQAEGEAGSIQGARCGTGSRDSGIMPWAEGRCSTAEPPRWPSKSIFWISYLAINKVDIWYVVRTVTTHLLKFQYLRGFFFGKKPFFLVPTYSWVWDTGPMIPNVEHSVIHCSLRSLSCLNSFCALILELLLGGCEKCWISFMSSNSSFTYSLFYFCIASSVNYWA